MSQSAQPLLHFITHLGRKAPLGDLVLIASNENYEGYYYCLPARLSQPQQGSTARYFYVAVSAYPAHKSMSAARA